MAEAPAYILSAVRRTGVGENRLRYEISGGLTTIKGMCFGVFFIDAPWSGQSRTSFARLTEAIARLDKNRQLELVVVGIDDSPGLADIPELRNRIGGWGETAWVFRGRILKTANNGRDVEPNTIELLGHERSSVLPAPLPTTVVQLANALYHGEDCGFALHDALLEEGHTELADHFRNKQAHPKGCWVLDLLLGKE